MFRRCTLLVLLLALGCSDTAGTPPPSDSSAVATPAAGGLVGSWEIVATAGAGAAPNQGIRYVFEADGRVRIGAGAIASEGTWTRSGDTLSLRLEGQIRVEALVSLEGDGQRLVYSMLHSEQVLTMQRR